jgi:hypothetical protein
MKYITDNVSVQYSWFYNTFLDLQANMLTVNSSFDCMAIVISIEMLMNGMLLLNLVSNG